MDTRAYRIGRSALIIASIVVLTAFVSGCGTKPTSTAQTYIDELKLYNYPACYKLLSHQDRKARTLDEFLTEVPLAAPVGRAWFRQILRVSNYRVDGMKMIGDEKAVVTVKVTRPDLPRWERTIDASAGTTKVPDPLAERSLSESKYPKISYDDNVVLVKEDRGWRILVDFPKKEKVYKQHQEALKLYHEHDYDKAIALYQKMIDELDTEQATGNEGLRFLYGRELREIQNIKSQVTVAEAYIPKLKLSDVKVGMAASQVPGMFGKVSNTGDRAIDEVDCTVTFYKGKGRHRRVVYTEKHTIIANPIEFIDFARPVLPLVPGETRQFGFTLDAPIKIQRESSPVVKVTNLVFTQSKAPLPKLPKPAALSSPSASPSPTAVPATGTSKKH